MNEKIKMYTGTALSLSLLLTILKTLCYLFCFDRAVGYLNNTFLVSLTNAITWIGALWCVGALLLIPKNSIDTRNQGSMPLVGGLLAAILVSASGAGLFVTNLLEKNELSLAGGTLLFAGSAFFWFSLTKLSPKALRCLAMVATLGFVSILIVSHFDMFTAINSPLKMAIHLSAVSAVIMLLAETRLLFGEKVARFSFVTKMLAALLCFPTSIGHLALYFADKMPALSEQTTNVFFSLALLGVAIYSAIRLFAVTDAQDLAAPEEVAEEEKEIEKN